MTTVATFEIHYTQFLDTHGKVVQSLPEFAKDPTQVVSLYRAMVLTRTLDAKAVALQRTGQLGTYASSLGQEAVGVAVAGAMGKEDVFFPTYRESGALMIRGVRMVELLRYWSGNERGSDYQGPREDFPICVPIATQIGHAVGAAAAFKLRKQPKVAVTMGGDGATSKGDFYEAINLAGAWHLPVVFMINNNQWAISVPRKAQTASQTLAQKAIAAGIEGLQVDGNDVIAVYHAARTALDKARGGGGPTLIEALTYRLSDHTTADDATRYRDAEEVARQWQCEPVIRLRNYLLGMGAWDKDKEEHLLAECADKVQAAVSEYLATPAPPPEDMFDYLYASLPAALQSQRADIIAQGGGHG